MAHRFKTIDRNTPLFLPPDLRDWVAEDDLVHLVISAVDRLPLSTFAVNHKGCGDEQYPPHLMLALLIYCYANGLFSFRRIERATYRDVAVRFLTANHHPDHDHDLRLPPEQPGSHRPRFRGRAGTGPRTPIAQTGHREH